MITAQHSTCSSRLSGLFAGNLLAVVLVLTVACGPTSLHVEGPAQLGGFTIHPSAVEAVATAGHLDDKDGLLVGVGLSSPAEAPYADQYSFFGSEGQMLRVVVDSQSLSPVVSVQTASGQILAEAEGYRGTSNLQTTLPGDDLYLVIVSSAYRETGGYRLEIERFGGVGGSPSYPVIGPNETVTARYNDTSNFDPGGRPGHVFAVELPAGSDLTVSLSSGADTYLFLFDASGVEVAADDDGGMGFNSLMNYTTAIGGRHFILATTYSGRPSDSEWFTLRTNL